MFNIWFSQNVLQIFYTRFLAGNECFSTISCDDAKNRYLLKVDLDLFEK